MVGSLRICHSVEEAREIIIIAPKDFDLVAIDHDLPELSGLEFCRQLLDQGVTLPLVLLAPEDFGAQLNTALGPNNQNEKSTE